MKNIHLIPTDKARLYLHQGKLYDHKTTMHIANGTQIPQNIYITSNGEIKDGDWYIFPIHKNGFAIKLYNSVKHFSKEPCISLGNLKAKKIILTTDQDLIKEGVQAIDDEFLEWFINNPSCEEVEIERDSREVGGHNGGVQIEYGLYEILIPKEKQKQQLIDMMKGDEELGLYEKLKQDWFCPKCDSYVSSESVTFDETHQTCNTGVVIKEPKQETLEEAAEKFAINIQTKAGTMSRENAIEWFKAGFRYQAKIMHSDEEVFNLCRAFATFVAHKDPSYKKQQEWFEQFKKY